MEVLWTGSPHVHPPSAAPFISFHFFENELVCWWPGGELQNGNRPSPAPAPRHAALHTLIHQWNATAVWGCGRVGWLKPPCQTPPLRPSLHTPHLRAGERRAGAPERRLGSEGGEADPLRVPGEGGREERRSRGQAVLKRRAQREGKWSRGGEPEAG